VKEMQKQQNRVEIKLVMKYSIKKIAGIEVFEIVPSKLSIYKYEDVPRQTNSWIVLVHLVI